MAPLPDALQAVKSKLELSRSYVAIFGTLPNGDFKAKKAALRAGFSYLARTVHPDHVAPKHAKEAAEIFHLLNAMRQAAETAIETGSYDQPISSTKAASSTDDSTDSVLQSAVATYRLHEEPFKYGDFSTLFRGRMLSGAGGEVIAKIASEPSVNTWLEREARLLACFRDASKTNLLNGIRRFVPELLDTFLVSGVGSTRYRVNVLKFVPDFVSVADIIEAFPRGLDFRDAAWINRRVLAQTLAANMAQVVHGALVPDHILVDPFKHEPLHIGWVHAVDEPWNNGKRVTHIVDRWRDYYPPEVFERKVPDHRTDLFMAAKVMIKLLGGDPRTNSLPRSHPEKMTRLILMCVENSPARRPENGHQVLDEYTRIVRSEWGKGYRPLAMPVR